LNPWIKSLYTPKHASLMSEGSIEEEAEREIHLVLNDRNHPYWDDKHPAHREAVERMQKLYEIVYRDKPRPPT
jgi:hypothetical protein